jgi:MFS family permease
MAKTVRLYYLFRGLSSAFLFKVFLVFFYLERGLDFAHIGILQAIFATTVILFEIPTGFWADRIGRKRTMGYGALLMSFAALGYYFANSFLLFACFEFALALGLTLTSGADSAFLYDALKKAGKEKRYSELEGKAGFAKHTGMAISALIGGIIAMKSLAALFPTTALVIFLSYLVTRYMDRSIPYSYSQKPIRASLHWKESIQILKSKRAIWWTILYSSLVFLLIRASDTLLQPVLKANGFQYWKIGILAAMGSMVAAFAAKNTGFIIKRWSEKTLVILMPGVLILSYALFATGSGLVLGLIVLANLGVQGFYSPFTKTMLNRNIENSSVRATMLSLESSIKRMVIAVAMPVIGLIIDSYGLKGGLITLVILGGCALVILLGSLSGKVGGLLKSKTGYKGRDRSKKNSRILIAGINSDKMESHVCSATGKPAP